MCWLARDGARDALLRPTRRAFDLRLATCDHDEVTIRAIFYDAGHTLVHPRPEIDEVWDFLAHQLGITIDSGRRGEFPDVAAFFYSRLGEDGLGSYASDEAARSFWSA